MSELDTRRYVERVDQMGAFEVMLNNPRGKERVCAIIGPGGIGKTWLMKAMMEKARNWQPTMLVPEILIDMYSTDHRYLEGVMDAVVSQLQSRTGPCGFAEYLNQRPELDAARMQLAESRNMPGEASASTDYSGKLIESKLGALQRAFRDCLVEITRKQPVVLAFDTFENVQDGPVGRWILDPKGMQMPGLVCIVASRYPWRKDQQEVAGLTDDEALEFFQRYMKSEDLITPELVGQELVAEDTRAEIVRLNAKAERNPLLLGLAITWWQDNPSAIAQLDQLSKEEFRRQIVWSLHSMQATGSRNLGGIELDEGMYQTLVMIAAMNRRFGRFFLDRLIAQRFIKLGDTFGEQIWRNLQKPHFFFVKQRPEGEVQLHDVLAELLREHLLADVLGDEMGGEPGERWQALMQDIAFWYDDMISQAPPDTGDVLRSEKLAYAFQLDAPVSRQRADRTQAQQLLLEYERRHSDVLDRLIVADFTRKADGSSQKSADQQTERLLVDLAIRRFSAADQYEIYKVLGEMGARVRLFDQSAKCWEGAAGVAHEMDSLDRYEREIQAFIGQHNSTWSDHPEACLTILDQALAICDKAPELRANVLYEIAFTCNQLQDLEEAVVWYEKAREITQAQQNSVIMGTVFNDMGYAYLLLGNDHKAGPHIRTALRLRQDRLQALDAQVAKRKQSLGLDDTATAELRELEAQRSEASLKLGMTYSTLGEMARFNDKLKTAERDYSRAYEVFVKEGDYFWQARALFSRGEANRRYAVKLYEEEDREYKTREVQAELDMEDSLELCRRYGLTQISATAHRRRGRLLHDQALRTDDLDTRLELLELALEHFDAGLAFAVEGRDMLEELENLTEIAFLADGFANARFPEGCCDPRLLEQEYTYIERLRSALEEKLEKRQEYARNGRPLIFQFDVFQDLLEIELGAYHFALCDFDESLRHYLAGYTGLAADPGYGSARYTTHIRHLFGNITKLAKLAGRDRAKEWCQKFIDVFQNEKMCRQDKTIAEAHLDFVTDFEDYRSTIGLF